VIRSDGDVVRSGHTEPAIQRKEVDKPQKQEKAGDFTVKPNHGLRGSYLIHFSKPFTQEEVLGILFKGGMLPQGLRLEKEGLTLSDPHIGLVWTWKLSTASGVIEPTTFETFSSAFRKHFSPETLELTPEESASIHAKSEAFLDSRPVYLGGQSVREAFNKCRDHEVVGSDLCRKYLGLEEVGSGFEKGCWGKRGGFFYYVGYQLGHRGRVHEAKSASRRSEIINRDWEWWLNGGCTLNEAELAEEQHQLWILQQVVLNYAGALASVAGAMRRPTVPPSPIRQIAPTVAKGVQAYEAWKVAEGKNITETDQLLIGLAGILEGAAEFLPAGKRPASKQLPSGPTPPAPKQLPPGPTPPAPKQLPSGPTPPAPKLLPPGPTAPAPKQLPPGPTPPAPKLLPPGPTPPAPKQLPPGPTPPAPKLLPPGPTPPAPKLLPPGPTPPAPKQLPPGQPPPKQLSASRVPQIVMGDVKSIYGYKEGLVHVSEMEGREKYNTNGNIGIALYDRETGDVYFQVYGQRAGPGQPRKIIYEGPIGRIEIPAGRTPIQIGGDVEEPVRELVRRVTGQPFLKKPWYAHGPDLMLPNP
jgi:hypothetical protein